MFLIAENISTYLFNCNNQIWDLQSWQCLKSLQVLAFIIQRGNQCLPTTNVEDGLPLEGVNYIYSSGECLVLSYTSMGGVLTLENYELKLWYDEDVLENNFHPFPPFINSSHGLINIAISDDQQYVSIRSGGVS